jgi:predicted aspartyl protease
MSLADRKQFHPLNPKQQRVGDKVPETDPATTGEPLDSSILVGASGNEFLLEVEVENQPHRFLIDIGASLSLVKPGISQAEVRPTNTAARGISVQN